MTGPDDRPSGRVPFGIKAAFGTGAAADGIKNTVFNQFLLFYYTAVLGLPGSMAGAALFLAMCFDAVSDPLVGYLSDHTRTRWGRRHPYMYASVVPMGISTYLLLSPPADLGTTALFVWMTAFSISVRLSLTLHLIPRGALVPEITYNYDERTSLIAASYLMGVFGGLAVSQAAWLVIMPSVDGGRLNPDAYAHIGMIAALGAAGAILVSALGTHRVIPDLRRPERIPLSFAHFFGELRNALRNHSFRMIMIGSIIISAAANFQEVFGLYMNTYFWEFSDGDLAALALCLAVAVVISAGATRRISEFSDKRRTAIVLACFLFAWAPLPILGRFAGLMPENGSAWLLPIIGFHLTVAVVPLVSLGILFSSMFSDTIDESELETGIRQEGVFGAAIAFSIKAVAGVGNLLGGIALEAIDFPTGAAAGTVPADKVFWLGIAAGPALTIFYVVGFYFLSRYRISRERYAEIRAELDRRARAADPPTGARDPGHGSTM